MDKKRRFRVKVQCLHEMSGSCFLITAYYPNGKIEKFIIDCGRFNPDDNNQNDYFPFDPKDCIFSIITHAHDDHLTRCPLFQKQGFKGLFYATNTTCDLANFILYSTSHIFQKEQKDFYVEPLYNNYDVEKTLKQFRACAYRRTIKPTKNISFVLYENGHIPGACIILLVISYPGEKDIRLLFTGDYHYKNMFFEVPPLPPEVTDNYLSLLVTESTYGTTNSYDDVQEGKIVSLTKNALEQGKTVIIPSFALQRSQEVVYLLGNAQASNTLPSVPIILDGRSAQYFHYKYVYESMGFNINTRKLLPPTLKYIKSLTTRKEVICDKEPKIVIAPGGCSDFGSIVPHMMSGVPREDVLVLYPGYTSPISMGGRLREAQKGDYLDYHGESLKVMCDVAHSSELSGHAKKDEIINHIIRPCSQTKSILTTHGDLIVKEPFTNELQNTFPNMTVGMASPNLCYTVEADGIVSVDTISIY